jgi:HEXXH motif-containing protein
MTATHVVPSGVFDLLASGDGDTQGVLRAGQRSKRLLLVHALVAAAGAHAPRLCADVGVDKAFAVLVEAQRRSAHTVDELLLQPPVGTWATRTLRSLVSGDVDPADLGHLGAVAAAAAVRAGHDAEVTSHLRQGTVMLPSFGLARLGTAQERCRIRTRRNVAGVEIVAGGTTVSVRFGGTRDTPTWSPLRRLRSATAGLDLEVDLDDIDPYRGCGQLPTAPRLAPSEVGEWQAKLDGAWSLLAHGHRTRAEAIAAGIRSLVPLLPSPAAPELSATCHESLGAIALTPPPAPFALVLALVHEFQHTKLSALLDLVSLAERASDELFYAPWRADPRPLRGLLQGAYAYLGLAAFSDGHRRHDDLPGGADDLAHFEFALWRDQVGLALRALRQSARLTPAGRRFVRGMGGTLSRLRRHSVPTHPLLLARVARDDHATSWRLRNVRPHPDLVNAAASAWLCGQPCPTFDRHPHDIVDGDGPMPSSARLSLVRRRLTPAGPQREGADRASPGDTHLVSGNLGAAAEAYVAQIAADADDLASWAGLVLVRRHLPTAATPALTAAPEAVTAVHRRIRAASGVVLDPERLAVWMAGGSASGMTGRRRGSLDATP